MEKFTFLSLESMLARRLLMVNEARLKSSEKRSGGREVCHSTESLLLDELLEDIRRSRTSSAASTPTKASPDLRSTESIRYTATELEGCGEREVCGGGIEIHDTQVIKCIIYKSTYPRATTRRVTSGDVIFV